METHRRNAEEIFNEAVEITDRAKRKAYLDKACRQDKELWAEVEELLKANDEAGDFLAVPDVGPDVTLEARPAIEGPGTRIGRYKLLELIGEGGMGLVYLAEQQEPVRRQVALKIIKPGMDSRQVISRFEAERQALALLDHPNIARVLDAGTTETGRPYFVMEYVKGMSVTSYCDRHKLSIEQRLKLFQQVCYGVQHAHQKGIIHRDIKPSNILVSVQDDRPVPKIIDFGIAKAVAQPLTQQTLFTRQGQLLGTPEYMSPEQADTGNEDIDTRADIYSLGIVLYELLAGVLPFEHEVLQKLGFAELQRTLREEEPPRPSLRFTALGEEAKEIAERRHTQVVALARRLHRELEWIPLKAMRKDRSRRYRSASEVADDIQNYLNGAPLIAGPETAIYRIKKFMRKYAGSVATALLVAAAIILGLIVSTTMYFRAEKALQKEAVARGIAEEAQTAEVEQRQIAEAETKRAMEIAETQRKQLYFNHIALADVAYREGNIGRLRKLLDACPENLRNWEWYRLNHISDQSLMTIRGHTDKVFGMVISPDGKRIASCSEDKTIKIWDTATGAEVMTLRGHTDKVFGMAISPDGKRIASCSEDITIKVWDAVTGAELMTLRGHSSWIWSVAFSPDGKRLVSGSSDKTIKVWDLSTGNELMTIRGHERMIGSVSFSPDGRRIVSGSKDWTLEEEPWNQTIKVWDAATGAELMTLPGHYDFVNSIDISPDGKRIISGSRDIKVWDAATGEEIMTLRGHKLVVAEVAFSPDGKRIVSGSNDGTIKVWDVSTGAELMILRGHDDGVSSVAFSPDGKRIISSSKDKTIKVWDTEIRAQAVTFVGHGDWVLSVAFSPDGKRLVSGDGDAVAVWNVETGAELMTLRGHDNKVTGASFSPDGKRIASGSADKTIKIWDAETGNELMTLRGYDHWVGDPSFSPDGRRIVSSSKDSTVRVWDAATGEELMILRGHGGRRATFSPDGKRIILGGIDGAIKVWDSSTGAEVVTFQGHDDTVWSAAFSPDGKRIVSGSPVRDHTIKVWDARTGAEVLTLPGDGPVVGVVFSPDGKRIISGSWAGTIKVWDSATGTELMTLAAESISSVAFSPDGKTIAAGTYDAIIKLWESTKPAGGYESRNTVTAARKLVAKLHEERGFYSEVIEKLATDNTLTEPVRQIALQIAGSRRWEDAEKLTKESWHTVSKPDANSEDYRRALQNAEKANDFESNNWSILKTLGAAQYRVGSYEDALGTLTNANKMRTDAQEEADPANVAFLAMTLHKLDRAKDAQAALDRMRDLCKDKRFAGGKKVQAFLFEAEKLFAGKNTKLYSVWEHIEAEKIEQAVHLLQELYASKDMEIVERMEGAVKWLGRIYYDRAKNHVPEYTKTITGYEKAMNIDSSNTGLLNDLAWLRINCPPGQVRDTAKAIEEAKRACELTEWKNYHYISTFAAVCSEVGDSNSAVKWQQQAIDLLPENERTQWQTNYEQRLELYKSGKPYHQGDLWSFSTGKMVAWWKFDESDANTVPDSSGNGLDGKLVGDAHVVSDAERGKVLSLDGNGDYVNCGDSVAFDVTGSITVAAWIEVGTFDKDKPPVIDKGGYTWGIGMKSNGMMFWCYPLGFQMEAKHKNWGWGNAGGSVGVNDGKWHHVAGVYDGTKMCFYVDGTLDQSVATWGNIGTSQSQVRIGGNSEHPERVSNVLIDDVRIYSYALSESEIKALYAGQGPGPGEKREELQK
jgi:WD40 repeat protein